MTTHATTTAPVRRSFDRLDVVRVGHGCWNFQTTRQGAPRTGAVLVVHLVRGRATLRQRPESTDLTDGDLIVIPADTSYDVTADAGAEVLVARIPDTLMGRHRPAIATMLGERMSTERGTASLVANLLRDLAAQDDYTPSQPGRLADHVVGLVGLMCIDGGLHAGRPRQALLQRATDYIEQHLADLDLTPHAIATQLNVSTRTLHRLFESEGLTINGWTRSRRLEHCRLDLLDSAHAEVSVSTIGARWGLWDAAHFSRVFKSTYGLSPRAYRTAAAAGALDEQLAAGVQRRSA